MVLALSIHDPGGWRLSAVLAPGLLMAVHMVLTVAPYVRSTPKIDFDLHPRSDIFPSKCRSSYTNTACSCYHRLEPIIVESIEENRDEFHRGEYSRLAAFLFVSFLHKCAQAAEPELQASISTKISTTTTLFLVPSKSRFSAHAQSVLRLRYSLILLRKQKSNAPSSPIPL